MTFKISYLTNIQPIESFEEFGIKLLNNATSILDNTNPLNYFAEKIASMKTFSLGIYQWAIVDFADQKLFEIGGMLEEMTGKPYEYWKNLPAEVYVTELAPQEHIPFWMAYINYIYSYILQHPNKSYHPQIFLKMKDKNGHYRNVVMQFIDWKHEQDGGVRYCLCQITDIAHLEPDYVPQLAILITENGVNKLIRTQAMIGELNQITIPAFTKRELDVLQLMAGGCTSKLIADKLHIAKNTVENYRQKLLRKTNCHTSSEVIAYAINHGLLK